MKFIFFRFSGTIFFWVLLPALITAQIQYSRHFTKELERCQATFVAPVEGWYKIKLLKDQFGPQYDLSLESDEKDFEMHFSLQPDYRANVPHISCLSTVSTLALNDDQVDIQINFFTPEQTKQYFEADWAAYADFVPKPSLTDKAYGRLVTIFLEGRGLIQEVFFFNKHDNEKDRRIYSIAFMKQPFEPN